MENKEVLHVVMFPWLAMGHLIPFLRLSKYLGRNGHRVSFVSTPRNIQRLPKIPSDLAPLIDLISLPLPKVDNLPDHAESSMDIPHQKSQSLKIAFDLLQPALATFLENTRPTPDWIIYDYASHWVPPMAAKLGISCAYFSLFSAATMAFIGPPSVLVNGDDNRSTAEDFTVVPAWVPFQSDVAYRLHEVMKFIQIGNESGASDMVRFGASVGGSDVVLFRTRAEFEPEWFNLCRELYQKPVVPVGFLPPSPEDIESGTDDETWVYIKEWLDKQSVNSVVYVALGTEATLSQEELSELALGLEQSGMPFFWVLRKPAGSTQDESGMIPDGYEQRVKSRGVIWKEWAPQAKILSCSAIGGFLTHCGWNSVVEGLASGRVLIMLPVMNEQGLNVRLLQGKKIGVEIPRNERDGWFTSESVAKSVRLAMVSEEGESARANAREMKGLFGDEDGNGHYLHSSIRYLVEARISLSQSQLRA